MDGAERTLGDHFEGESREFTQEDCIQQSARTLFLIRKSVIVL